MIFNIWAFRLKLLAIVLISFLPTACRKRQIQPSKNSKAVSLTPFYQIDSAQSSKDSSLAEELKPISLDFKYLNSNAKVDFLDGTNEEKFKATIRICKDSLIWISLQANVGVEGMRILIDKDSIRFLNYQAKTYQSLAFTQLSNYYGISLDFGLCQAILLGEMPVKTFDAEKVLKDTSYYIIRQRLNFVQLDNYLRQNDKQLEKLQVRDTQKESYAEILYSAFQKFKGGFFPEKKQVTLRYRSQEGEVFLLRLFIEHKKTHFSEQPLEFPFNVPRKYSRL